MLLAAEVDLRPPGIQLPLSGRGIYVAYCHINISKNTKQNQSVHLLISVSVISVVVYLGQAWFLVD